MSQRRASGMILSALVQADLRALSRLGLDPAPVMSRMGLSGADLERLPQRVPFELTERFWHAVRLVYPDENLSVRIPELAQPEEYDLLGYLCRSAANLREALHYLNRFNALLLGGYNQLSLREAGETAVLTIEAPCSVESQSVEAFMATIGFVARHLTGQPARPIEVRYRHRPPRDPSLGERLFWVKPLYRASENQVVLPKSYLDLPLVAGDPRLRQLLERQAEELVAGLDDSGGFAQALKKAIARELPRGNPSAPSIARTLGVSVRTLSRRLDEHSTSFRALHDEVRHELACRYLRATDMSAGEIAFLLGFADASSFNRAFRRWSGVSSMAYRAAQAGETPDAG